MITETVGVVILAAGGSTRLGRPKQLVIYRGETLVRHAARAACSAGCAPVVVVVVVVGDERERIEEALSPLEVHVFHHAQWQRGIGSSIRAGVARALALNPTLDAVLLMVCDQPFVSAGIIAALVAARARTQNRAIACAYGGTFGVPALFDRGFFPSLLALPDEQGAKHLFSAADEIARVEFPQGNIDIDTPADLRAITLLDSRKRSGNETVNRQGF